MIDLSPSQYRFVRKLLRDARDGQSSYGGNIAEVYVYMLFPCHDPMWATSTRPLLGGLIEFSRHELAIAAGRNLCAMLNEFTNFDISVETDNGWRKYGKWLYLEAPYLHRWHIRFQRRKKPARKTVYVLGISSPAGFEELHRTNSKSEATDWIAKPSGFEDTMHTFGVREIKSTIESDQ